MSLMMAWLVNTKKPTVTIPTNLEAQIVTTPGRAAVRALLRARAATVAARAGLRPDRSSAEPKRFEVVISNKAETAVITERMVVARSAPSDDDDDDDIHCTRACAGAKATMLELRMRRNETVCSTFMDGGSVVVGDALGFLSDILVGSVAPLRSFKSDAARRFSATEFGWGCRVEANEVVGAGRFEASMQAHMHRKRNDRIIIGRLLFMFCCALRGDGIIVFGIYSRCKLWKVKSDAEG